MWGGAEKMWQKKTIERIMFMGVVGFER